MKGANAVSKTKQKIKLPKINTLLSSSSSVNPPTPPPSSSSTRAIPHQRGNWAVHIHTSMKRLIDPTIISEALANFTAKKTAPIEDPHLTFNRLSFLQPSSLASFEAALTSHLSALKLRKFTLSFSSKPIVLSNDENTRSFVAFKAVGGQLESCGRLLDAVNSVLRAYGQEAYYEEPIFHVSVGSFLGVGVGVQPREINGDGDGGIEEQLFSARIDNIVCALGGSESEKRFKIDFL